MESDAGSSGARRRRRLSVVVLSSVSLRLHDTLLLHEFLVGLGFLCSSAVAMCWRHCRCCHFIIWLLLSPSPALLTALVPDLFHKTNTPSICNSQIPDLKLLRHVLPSSSPTTMNFLPSGKIDANWLRCACDSRTSPLCPLFVRSMSLNSSAYFCRTTPTRSHLLIYPQTNPCSLQTPFEASDTDDCSTFLSLIDHNDRWLGFGSVKSSGLQHGNAGVGCLCLESTLVPSEVGVKPILLSVGIKVKSSLMTNFLMVKIHSVNAVPTELLELFRCSVHECQSLQTMKYRFVDSMVNIVQQCSASSSNLRLLKHDKNSPVKSKQPCCVCGVPGAISGVTETSNKVPHQRSILTRASIESLLFFGQSVLKIEDCSPLATSPTTMASQISSCRGHERSFSPVLLFAGENHSTKAPLYERYFSLGVKANECFHFPNRLISCVMVRLGPEDTTRIIPMRLEVVEYSTSRHMVTISKSEDFKGRSNFSMTFLASGSFDVNLDTLSNISMFVSLSLVCFAFKFPKLIAHHMFDGAWIQCISKP